MYIAVVTQAGKLKRLFTANLSAFLVVSVVNVIGAKPTNFPPKSHAYVNWGSMQATAASFVKDKKINDIYK